MEFDLIKELKNYKPFNESEKEKVEKTINFIETNENQFSRTNLKGHVTAGGFVCDENGEEYKDNDERCIFFARGVLETVKKLRWTPNIVHCSGWMSALTPLFIKKLYNDTPFFENSKVVLSLDSEEFDTPFNSKFAEKIIGGSVLQSHVRGIAGLPVAYEDLMRLAIDYCDAIVLSSENVNQRLLNYAQNSGKPIMPYVGEDKEAHLKFYNELLGKNEEDEE